MKLNKSLLPVFLSAFILAGTTHCQNRQEIPEQSQAAVKTGTDIGEVAPEINYPNPDGKDIALSSLRGKMVLIDFWAAWCPPCRTENPNLVRSYHEFKDKSFTNGEGFTIYSVSLDRTKEDWVKAINDDKLEWEYHVSDLKFWRSAPAALYEVMAIPANFLIDGNGVILARNLRGAQLDAALKSYLK